MKISFLLFASIMLLTGVGIPLMAALNAGLGQRIGSPTTAVFILCCFTMLLSGTIMLLMGLPEKRAVFSAPIHFYLGGFFFVFYILSVTVIAPKFGLGNAVFFVLLGQLISAAAIDHFGLLNLPIKEISWNRAVGLVLMSLGVFMAVKA